MVRLSLISRPLVARFSTVVRSLRNVGIIAHIDAGKTTTTERILFNAGKINYVGEVDKGTTVTDYLDQERERGISIISATATFKWNEHNINLIDTPGHVDFTLEVERALTVLDGSITILDATKGVQAQTLTVWNQAKKHRIANIFYINKFDRKLSNLNLCLKSIKNRLPNVTPLLIHLPYYSEDTGEFCGILDIVDLKLHKWLPSNKNATEVLSECHSRKISDSEPIFVKCLEARLKLIETLADLEDGLIRNEFLLLENPAALIPSKMIHNALKTVTISSSGSVVLIGSSRMNIGVTNLLDKIVDYLPNPSEKQLPPQFSHLASNPDHLSALAFKVVHDHYRGPLTFLRLYSGSLTPRTSLKNLTRSVVEKVDKIVQMTGEQFTEIGTCSSGSIVAVSGFKNCYTGDVLVDVSMPHISEEETFANLIPVPDPVIFASIEAYSVSEIKQLEEALTQLAKEDPGLSFHREEDTRQLVIGGMGHLHLEVILERIKSDFKLHRTKLGKLKIAYKECPSLESESVVSYDHSLSCIVQGINTTLSMTLIGSTDHVYNEETHVDFVNNKEFYWNTVHPMTFNILKASIHNAIHNGGPILKSPLMGMKVSVYNFNVTPHFVPLSHRTNHPILRSFIFDALRGLFKKFETDLLEPIMLVEISFSDAKGMEYISKVKNDLNKRRGKILNTDDTDEASCLDSVRAYVPLSELMDYSTTIRSLTSGQSSIHMNFSHYDRMAREAQDHVTKKRVYRPISVLDEKQ